MADKKGKRSVFYLSSTDEEEESVTAVESDCDEAEEISGDAIRCIVDVEENESDNSFEDESHCKNVICLESESDNSDEEIEPDQEEILSDNVICLLREGKDLEALSLKECKAYLRKHGLRLAGDRAVCIRRIKEHWRVKDGNGELLYPRSSFSINCKGDVCKGDVVLFTQKVYAKFRRGNCCGIRTVAGRVVKESYGSAKQQHTFTVEVLWSKGIKKLPPLFPLLVKGRKLYKFKTFRQPWKNEAERIRVLAEKHKRGTAARFERAMRRSKTKQSADGRLDKGIKHKNRLEHMRPSQTGKTTELLKRKPDYGHKKDALLEHGKFNNHHQEDPPSRQLNLKRNVRSDVGLLPNWRHLEPRHLKPEMDPTFHSYAYTDQGPSPWQIDFYNQRVPFDFSIGSTSTTVRPPPFRSYADTVVMPAQQRKRFNYRNGIHDYHLNP